MPSFLYLPGFEVFLIISHRDRDSLPKSSSPLLICPLPCPNSGHHEVDHGLPLLKIFWYLPHHQNTAQMAQPGMVSRKDFQLQLPQPPLCPTFGSNNCKPPAALGTCFCLQPHVLLSKCHSLCYQHCELPYPFRPSAVIVSLYEAFPYSLSVTHLYRIN